MILGSRDWAKLGKACLYESSKKQQTKLQDFEARRPRTGRVLRTHSERIGINPFGQRGVEDCEWEMGKILFPNR